MLASCLTLTRTCLEQALINQTPPVSHVTRLGKAANKKLMHRILWKFVVKWLNSPFNRTLLTKLQERNEKNDEGALLSWNKLIIGKERDALITILKTSLSNQDLVSSSRPMRSKAK